MSDRYVIIRTTGATATAHGPYSEQEADLILSKPRGFNEAWSKVPHSTDDL
jgi:hypothetical protein